MVDQYILTTNLPASIFRAYDIRGIVNETLTPDIIFTLGLAIGSEARLRGEHKIIVGYDGRTSSPLFVKALEQGLMQSGCDVIDIGMVPTPILYFATHRLSSSSGIMVTGSHNPSNYNGLKIILGSQRLTADEIKSLRTRVLNNVLESGQGSCSQHDVVQDYIDYIVNDIKLEKPLRVVIDCGNGVGGKVAPTLFKKLGCDLIPLFCKVDGDFPNHHPDPSIEANLQALIEAVKKEKADIGLAFDGDADRLGVVTNLGEIIWPDRQLMLFAQDILTRHPGANVVFDVKCSKHLPTVIREAGGRPHLSKTGHSLIKNRMLALGALFAGEMSGHIFFQDRWFGFDDGLYAGARLLEIVSRVQKDVSRLFRQFPSSVNTPELKVNVSEKEKFSLVKRLVKTANFPEAHINTMDGLRVEFPTGWALVRASNTTACLTLRFEADTEADLRLIQDKLRAHILAVDPKLQLPF